MTSTCFDFSGRACTRVRLTQVVARREIRVRPRGLHRRQRAVRAARPRRCVLKLFGRSVVQWIMPYRDDLAALRSREDALARELAGTQQELDEIRRTIDGLRPRFRLRVASPCPADWNAMQGDDRVRFCGQCEKNVYNLSAMTHA